MTCVLNGEKDVMKRHLSEYLISNWGPVQFKGNLEVLRFCWRGQLEMVPLPAKTA